MKKILLMFALVFSLIQQPALAEDASCASWLDEDFTQLHAEDVIHLCAETAGKPVLLVNTASYCGFTYQFTGLESLYQKYRNEGLIVVGFPSDDFNQEDDDASKTAEVCYVNHGVTFLMTNAIKVKGSDAHPLFRHLAEETSEPSWNFNKYLVDKQGNVVEHFDSRVEPDSEQLLSAIDSVL
jgi:glutathione peroxidase